MTMSCGFIFLIGVVTAATGQQTVAQQGCGGNYEGTKGSITSPNWGNGNYPSHSNCTWTINVPEGNIVKMTFEFIDVEGQATCFFDGVLLYDTTKRGSPPGFTQYDLLLGKTSYCGDQKYAPILSNTNLVGVHFYSDEESEKLGFRLNWKAEVPVPGDRFNCTFEQGLCKGWHDLLQPNDDFDWTLHSHRTPTTGTGPTFDHTLRNPNGRYIYIETSAPRLENDTAVLVSPQMSFSEGEQKMCITFWYHMFGTSTGTLFVAMTSANDNAILWVRSGEQGVSWLQGKVELTYTPHPFQILFTGIRGKQLYGDIALDDVSQSNGACSDSASSVETVSSTTLQSSSSLSTPMLNSGLIEPPLPTDIACSSDFYKCISGSTCIPRIFLCDGTPDCPDKDDELNCHDNQVETTAATPTPSSHSTTAAGSACPPDMFQCIAAPFCIPRAYHCDGFADCPNADEINCKNAVKVVATTQRSAVYLTSNKVEQGASCPHPDDFHCGDGHCIAIWLKCNQANDCDDGSDEWDCSPDNTDEIDENIDYTATTDQYDEQTTDVPDYTWKPEEIYHLTDGTTTMTDKQTTLAADAMTVTPRDHQTFYKQSTSWKTKDMTKPVVFRPKQNVSIKEPMTTNEDGNTKADNIEEVTEPPLLMTSSKTASSITTTKKPAVEVQTVATDKIKSSAVNSTMAAADEFYTKLTAQAHISRNTEEDNTTVTGGTASRQRSSFTLGFTFQVIVITSTARWLGGTR